MSSRIPATYNYHHASDRTVRRSSTTSHKRPVENDVISPISSRRIHSLQQSRTTSKLQEQDMNFGSPSQSSQLSHSDTFSSREQNKHNRRPRPRRLSTPDLTDTLTNSRSDSDSELNSPSYRHNSRSSPQLSIPGAWPPTPLVFSEEPEEITVNGLNEEFDYVILRVPAKSRASSIASHSTSRRSMESSRRGSTEDLTERNVSRLSTPEASHLVQSIKALKTPVADQSKQFVMYSAERSSNWRVDDLGKYEYLVLRSSSQSTVKVRMSEELDKIACESDDNDEVQGLNIASAGFPLDEIADQWQDPPQSFSATRRASSFTEITASSLAFKPDEIRNSSPYQLDKSASLMDIPQRPRSRSLTDLRWQPIHSTSEPPHTDQMTPTVPEHGSFSRTLNRSTSGSQTLHRLLSTFSRRSLQSLRQATAGVSPRMEQAMEKKWEQKLEHSTVSEAPQSLLTRKYTLSRPSFWDPSNHMPETPVQHVPKPTLGFRILSIFQPRKMRVKSLVRQQHLLERGWAVERARSPCIAYMQDLGIHIGRMNPFAILRSVNAV